MKSLAIVLVCALAIGLRAEEKETLETINTRLRARIVELEKKLAKAEKERADAIGQMSDAVKRQAAAETEAKKARGSASIAEGRVDSLRERAEREKDRADLAAIVAAAKDGSGNAAAAQKSNEWEVGLPFTRNLEILAYPVTNTKSGVRAMLKPRGKLIGLRKGELLYGTVTSESAYLSRGDGITMEFDVVDTLKPKKE